jgi:ParB family chromosome partitioning protein
MRPWRIIAQRSIGEKAEAASTGYFGEKLGASERFLKKSVSKPRTATIMGGMAKLALGKGLGALINSKVASPTPVSELGERVQQIPLDQIIPSPLQPRTEFRGERLQELIDSIREHGVIQPLIVRQRDDKFELIAGERRWRASKEVGLAEAPAIVRQATDLEVLELALIENLQREDLNPIEEGLAFSKLAREFGLKQEEIATRVGKSRASIANSMRLLDLAGQVQSWVAQGRITVGHAKVLLAIKSAEEQNLIAEAVIRHNYTVRALEKVVSDRAAPGTAQARLSKKKAVEASTSAAVAHLQNRLQNHLATHVMIHHGEKKGRIEIEYYGADDLNRLLAAMAVPPESF